MRTVVFFCFEFSITFLILIFNRSKFSLQAVWAGWGHASENPNLPESLNKNNIIFMGKFIQFQTLISSVLKLNTSFTLGPPEGAMWALGDKIASTILAQSAGVPTLPWSGDGELLFLICRPLNKF